MLPSLHNGPAPRALGRLALAALALTMALPSLGASIANVALPTLAQAFDAPFQGTQWVVLAYLLAMTILIVGAGRVGDLLGHRKVLLFSLSLFTVASTFCALAPTLPILITARGLQGVGGAGLLALTPALIRGTVSRERVGAAMGLLGTLSAVGTAMGPSLGGLLVGGFGWRAIFLVLIPLGLLALGLGAHALPADEKRTLSEKTALDPLGTTILAATLAAYALALTLGTDLLSRETLTLITIAVLGGGLFLMVEKRSTAPLLPPEVLRDGPVVASLIGAGLVGTVIMTTMVVGPFYLTRALGLSEEHMGLVLSVGPLLSVCSGLPAGRLVDRLGAPTMVNAGLVGMAIGSLALALAPPLLGVPGYLAALALLTPSYQLFQAANTAATLTDVAPDRRGLLSGLLGLARNLGLISGASVMGALFAIASGSEDVAQAAPEAVTAGLRASFLTAAALMGVGLILSITLRPRTDKTIVLEQ
ncbi:MAG: MFS transporter [Rhodospirillum sp.]|nr:MFS transporter [Rhodospirillum sp.]MCF8491199.1 MFS transporter [Rhodospirillum sp.]MCF8499605.1 MFS transporter [Rhodospirillum sp.]